MVDTSDGYAAVIVGELEEKMYRIISISDKLMVTKNYYDQGIISHIFFFVAKITEIKLKVSSFFN